VTGGSEDSPPELGSLGVGGSVPSGSDGVTGSVTVLSEETSELPEEDSSPDTKEELSELEISDIILEITDEEDEEDEELEEPPIGVVLLGFEFFL